MWILLYIWLYALLCLPQNIPINKLKYAVKRKCLVLLHFQFRCDLWFCFVFLTEGQEDTILSYEPVIRQESEWDSSSPQLSYHLLSCKLTYLSCLQSSHLHKACDHFGPNEGPSKRRPHLRVSPQVWFMRSPWVRTQPPCQAPNIWAGTKINLFRLHPQIRPVQGERTRSTARTTTSWAPGSKWRKISRIINLLRRVSLMRTSTGRASCQSEPLQSG